MTPTLSRSDALRHFASRALGDDAIAIEAASADASFRSYWRVTLADGSTRVVMDAPPDKENIEPWLDIGMRLHGAGLHVPEVFALDRAQGFILMEDLGSRAYLPELTDARADALYGDALDALLRMQTRVDTTGLPVFDEAFLTMELEIMPEWFLRRHLGHDIACEEWDVIELAFMRLIDAARRQPQAFMHRDYHSRNLMLAGRHEAAQAVEPSAPFLPPLAGSTPSSLPPRAGSIPSSLPPRAGSIPSSLAPQAGSIPSSLPAQAGSTPSSLPPQAGSTPSSLPPQAGEGGAAAPEGGAFPLPSGASGSAASPAPLPPSAPSPARGGRNGADAARFRNPGIIDFQGAMLGPITYDLASLLRDCYIEWPAARVEGWLQGHREHLVRAGALEARVNAATFRRWFDLTGLQRHIKVLGIFCRLCYRDGKTQYLADLPLVWRYVMTVARCYDDLAPLADLLERALGARDITQPRAEAAA